MHKKLSKTGPNMQHQTKLVRSKRPKIIHKDHDGNSLQKSHFSMFYWNIFQKSLIIHTNCSFYRTFIRLLHVRLDWFCSRNFKSSAYKVDKIQYLLTVCLAHHAVLSMPTRHRPKKWRWHRNALRLKAHISAPRCRNYAVEVSNERLQSLLLPKLVKKRQQQICKSSWTL